MTSKQILDAIKKHPNDIEAVIGDYKKEAGAWIRFNPLDGTGVQNVAAKQNIAAGQKVDLQGRIVAQPVKGSVIIVDGKKVIAE